VNMDPDEYYNESDYSWTTRYRGFDVVVERLIPTPRNANRYVVILSDPRCRIGSLWDVDDLNELIMTLIALWERMDLYDIDALYNSGPLTDPDIHDPLV
jgi:hypothetical protein